MSLPARIETARLVLRCHRPADAPLLKAAIDSSLEHLRQWMPWAMDEPSTIEALEERMTKFAANFAAGEDWGYLIFDPHESQVLGGVGVHRRGEPDVLEIGYWLRVDQQGQGYVTEAVAALTDLSLGVEGVSRLEIRCDPRNLRSWAIPVRLGYQYVGTLQANTVTPTGAPRDTMVWELRRSAAQGATPLVESR